MIWISIEVKIPAIKSCEPKPEKYRYQKNGTPSREYTNHLLPLTLTHHHHHSHEQREEDTKQNKMAMAAPSSQPTGPNSPQTFLTETQDEAFGAPFEDLFSEDVGELEALVAGVTQTTQSTLLLKKRKEMREVDDALDFMKE